PAPARSMTRSSPRNDGITPPSVAVAETTGLSVKGAKVFALDAAQAYCPQYVTSS
ncbi:MAG: hypothetical protein QOC62_1010, partial [Mycobacterium sp.]|nr:hypothetical protein [Mycobacterium sp.]